MKLELKHLAPYLPYDLKYCRVGKNISTLKEEVKYMGIVSTTGTVNNLNNTLFGNFVSMKYLPLFRPLSDLLNEELDFYIDFNTILNEIDSRYLREAIVNKTFYSKDIHYSFEVWNCLLSMHFDVFELIKQGLAIDINTLDK